MEKTVGAFEIRRQLGRILQDVAAKGDRFVVERHGEPIAAVVPISVYQRWQRDREAFFERIRATQERADLSSEEAEALVLEAVKAVRASDEA